MSFEIYFDESHKLDKFTSDYSYYGVIGWEDNIRKQLDEFKRLSRIWGIFKIDGKKIFGRIKSLKVNVLPTLNLP